MKSFLLRHWVLLAFATTFIAATAVWQPPQHDLTMIGDGTHETPLGVDTTDIVATKHYTDSVAAASGGGASYLVYTALLAQTGTNAPVPTVLENTLGGTVVWTYVDVGDYLGSLSGAFVLNKTLIDGASSYNGVSLLHPFSQDVGGNNIEGYYSFNRVSANGVSLKIYDNTFTPINWGDIMAAVSTIPINIAVYNP